MSVRIIHCVTQLLVDITWFETECYMDEIYDTNSSYVEV